MLHFQTLIFVVIVGMVAGHARLIDPPSRSSMWRFGFNTPVNYNDNELFCGGLTVQHSTNKGRCGVCGDPYHLAQPRPNEAGGLYGKGIIVKTYKKGQIINIVVDVTANHLGYFEFKICPNNNPKKIVEQDCLDKYPLSLSNNSSQRFYIKPAYLGKVSVSMRLPEEVTCTQCVLQWQYRGENNWGRCSDGHGALGCGPQETFRACADIAIIGNDDEDALQTAEQEQVTTVVKRTSFPLSFATATSTIHPSSDSTMDSIASKTSYATSSIKDSSEVPSTRDFKTTADPLKTTNLEKQSTSSSQNAKQTSLFFRTTREIVETSSPSSSSVSILRSTVESTTDGSSTGNCKGLSNMRNLIPGLDYWCYNNCAMGHCPPNLCIC